MKHHYNIGNYSEKFILPVKIISPMKSVVMIAYYFPPDGSAGSYRPLRFVRHLAKNGWRATVIAADPYRYERFDPDLLSSVPSETEVVRVRARDPWQALQAWREQRFNETISRVSVKVADEMLEAQYKPIRSLIRNGVRTAEACHYQPDLAMHWIGPAVEATIRVCSRDRPNVLWATAGPVSSWIVARRVSQKTGIPYVLDLRDPHGLGYYEEELRQPKWVQRRIRRMMHRLFTEAQSVVFLFDTVAERYCRAFGGALDAKRIHIIPNGYEGAIEEFAPPNSSKLTVLYTGTLSSYRYDTFLQALSILKNSDPAKAEPLLFRFVGEGMSDLVKQAASLGLSDIVEATGPTTYAEITRLQQQSHAFLVFGRPATVIGHELVAGAKLFNYIKMRRPILGVLPADETRKILYSLGISTVADVDSPQDIVALLQQVINAWYTANLSSLLPDRTACEIYSAHRQTADLVRALDGLPKEHRYLPGSVELSLLTDSGR